MTFMFQSHQQISISTIIKLPSIIIQVSSKFLVPITSKFTSTDCDFSLIMTTLPIMTSPGDGDNCIFSNCDQSDHELFFECELSSDHDEYFECDMCTDHDPGRVRKLGDVIFTSQNEYTYFCSCISLRNLLLRTLAVHLILS